MSDADNSRPRVTVATLVARDGRLLFVEEEGGGSDGLVLNQPAGHLEPGESLIEAALRETLEETGWTVRLTHLVGIYQWAAPNGQHYVRIGFAGEPVAHDPERALDTGIHRALWLTPAEVVAERARLRSPLVLAQMDDWLAGARYPLAMARSIRA